MSLRIVFMGSPVFSCATLAEIVAAGHDVVAVYSQPPRPAGRGQAERPQPVHTLALELGIPVLTPKSLRGPEAAAQMKSHDADVAVVVAYGLLLPQAILDAPRHGCLNLHASLLPRWRGAAPIQRAIMAGDTETGIMVMRMEAGLDTGPVCLAERVAVGPDMTAGELHDLLSPRGADLMVRALAALERGSLEARPQSSEGVTYARKIEKAEARIDFARPAQDVHNQILRAVARSRRIFRGDGGGRHRTDQGAARAAGGWPWHRRRHHRRCADGRLRHRSDPACRAAEGREKADDGGGIAPGLRHSRRHQA